MQTNKMPSLSTRVPASSACSIGRLRRLTLSVCLSAYSVGLLCRSARRSARRPTTSACSVGLPVGLLRGSIPLASSCSLLKMASLESHRRHPLSPDVFYTSQSTQTFGTQPPQHTASSAHSLLGTQPLSTQPRICRHTASRHAASACFSHTDTSHADLPLPHRLQADRSFMAISCLH